jgi:hypothetical protein
MKAMNQLTTSVGSYVEALDLPREVPTEVTASVATGPVDWPTGGCKTWGLTNLFHEGNESANNFRRVVGLFIHGNRSHLSQVLQPPVGQSTGPVATEAVTSVGTSLGRSRANDPTEVVS